MNINGAAALRAAEARLAARTRQSGAAFEASRRVIPGGVTSNIRYAAPHPIFVREARGGTVWDLDGNAYVDCRLGFGPVLLGHGPEVVTAAVTRALVGGTVYALPHAGEAELAEKVVSAVPGAEMVNFCSSGSEATLHAIRLARAYTGRAKIAKFEGGYHGVHDAVMVSVNHRPELAGPVEAPVGTADSAGIPAATVADTVVLPFNHPAALDILAARAPELAAVIVEPVQGAAGSIPAAPAFLEGLRAVTARHGVVLIFDEVITGFRHALGGCQAICGVTPDLATFGKAAAAGYPVGLVAGRRDLLERVGRTGPDAVFMGGTFNGTPSTLAAILATIEELSQPETHRKLFDLGDYLRRELDAIVARVGLPAQSAGFGSVWLLYFFDGPYSRYEDLLRNDDLLDNAFRRELVAHRYIFQPLAMKRMYVSAAHDKAILDRALDVMESTLRKVSGSRVRPARATASS